MGQNRQKARNAGALQQESDGSTLPYVEDVSLVVFIYIYIYVVFIAWQLGGVIVGDPGFCCCGPAFNVMCDVNCSNAAITSHCLLII